MNVIIKPQKVLTEKELKLKEFKEADKTKMTVKELAEVVALLVGD